MTAVVKLFINGTKNIHKESETIICIFSFKKIINSVLQKLYLESNIISKISRDVWILMRVTVNIVIKLSLIKLFSDLAKFLNILAKPFSLCIKLI